MILKPRLFRKPNLSNPISKGLVGCWLMNEGSGNTVADLSGNGNTGTLISDVTWIGGDTGQALTFAGSNDWVQLPAGLPAFGTGDFTIIAKVKCPQDNAHRAFLSRGDAVGGGEALFYKDDTDRLRFYGDSGSINAAYLPQSDSWPDDVWTLVGVTRSGSLLTLYQNGVAGGIDATAGADLNDAASWRIGASNSGTYDYVGEMEYIYIYNRALSASEIQQLDREPFCGYRWESIIELASYVAAAGGSSVAKIMQQMNQFNGGQAA